MRLLFTFYFLLSFFYSFSQFNIIVEDSTKNHIYIGIVSSDTFIVVQNGTGDSLGNRGICFTKFDTLSNIVWEKLYTKNGEDWYEGYKSAIKLNDNEYISVINKNNKPGIILLNNDFDTILTKTYLIDTLGVKFLGLNKSK